MKKTLIIRKPGFCRNDVAMRTYIETADALCKRISKANMTLVEKYEMLKRIDECWEKAAEAGGFFNTNDFLRWMDSQNENLA